MSKKRIKKSLAELDVSQIPNYHEGKAVYINESRLLFELIQTFSKITRPLIFEKLLKVMYIFIDKKSLAELDVSQTPKPVSYTHLTLPTKA